MRGSYGRGFSCTTRVSVATSEVTPVDPQLTHSSGNLDFNHQHYNLMFLVILCTVHLDEITTRGVWKTKKKHSHYYQTTFVCYLQLLHIPIERRGGLGMMNGWMRGRMEKRVGWVDGCMCELID